MQTVLRVDNIGKNWVDYKGKSYKNLVLPSMIGGNLRQPATGQEYFSARAVMV